MSRLPLLPLLVFSLLTACSTPSAQPPVTKPAKNNTIQTTRRVETTSYSKAHDGIPRNALSTRLKTGPIYSAGADWSRFPVGTKFRVRENGRTYVVDDYGSALVGRDVIDLYTPSLREMRRWGRRKVTIDILAWGSYQKSYSILKHRTRASHVRRMVRSLEPKIRQHTPSRTTSL